MLPRPNVTRQKVTRQKVTRPNVTDSVVFHRLSSVEDDPK